MQCGAYTCTTTADCVASLGQEYYCRSDTCWPYYDVYVSRRIGGAWEQPHHINAGQQGYFSHLAISVVRSDGLVGNALSKCIGLGDTAMGDVSRCIWIDAAGEKIFSELTARTGAHSETGSGRGTFVGGTGRFEGITGSYEIDWVNVPSLDPEMIEGRSLKMEGAWKLP